MTLRIALGNILADIAIQTVVLVVLERFGGGPRVGLTYRAASLVLVLAFRLAPGDVLIVALWGIGAGWLVVRGVVCPGTT